MSTPEPRQTRAALSPGLPAGEAMVAVLSVCAADFERHRVGLMLSDDPSGPHGARVALRRLRTALDAFGALPRRRPARGLRREAREVFRLLGPLRDADVLAADHAGAADGPALAAEAARLRAEVRAALEAADAAGFAARVAALTAGDWPRRRARKAARRPVEALAAAALEAAWADVGSHGRKLRRMGVEDRHGFRKDLKALRYLTDFFGPLWPGGRQARFLERLKRLQEALGRLNDLAVAEARLQAAGLEGHGAEARAAAAGEALAEAAHDWKRLRRGKLWWGG